MHNDNYDRTDPRCIKFKGYIEALEECRVAYESPKESRFEPKYRQIQKAMDTIYRMFKREVGYAPAWLINALDSRFSKLGRTQEHTTDDRLANSVFIDLLVQRGSSATQATKLLSQLKGFNVVTPGFLKEARLTYNEFVSDFDPEHQYRDLANIGWLIADMLEFDLSKEPTSNELAFEKAVAAFRQLWQDALDLMREFHPLISEHDRAYPELFGYIPDRLKEDHEDPLKFFYNHPNDSEEDLHDRKNALREYLNATGFFRDDFDPKTRTVQPPPEPDLEDMFETVEVT